MSRHMLSRNFDSGARRVGNLWNGATRPEDQPVPIPGMGALSVNGVVLGDVCYAEMLQDSFDAHCDEFPQLKSIISQLQRVGVQGVVIGGWARDTILGRKPQDIDIVVIGADTVTLEGLLPTASRRTALGGFAFEYENIAVDLWSLQDTHLIRLLRLQPSLQTMMQVIDFDVNAILFTPAQFASKPSLLDGGMSRSVQMREIDFNCGVLPLPIAQVSRLAYFSAKLDFSLSPRVRQFMYEQCVSRGLRSAVEANLLQYCPAAFRQLTLDNLHAAVSPVN